MRADRQAVNSLIISNLTDATYSGVTTNSLLLTNVTNSMNSYKYRVQLSKIGNSCGLTSSIATLTVYALPIVKDIKIIQCGTDLLGFSTFNLTVKNIEISTYIVPYDIEKDFSENRKSKD